LVSRFGLHYNDVEGETGLTPSVGSSFRSGAGGRACALWSGEALRRTAGAAGGLVEDGLMAVARGIDGLTQDSVSERRSLA